MTKASGKKAAPRKRGGAYPYKPVSFIVNGIKYKPGQKPARVCPAPAVDPHPLSPFERHLVESISAAVDNGRQGGRRETDATAHIRQLATITYPKVKPIPLYDLRDKSIIKSMGKDSWRTRVAEARRKHKSHDNG